MEEQIGWVRLAWLFSNRRCYTPPARLGGLYWLCLHHTRCVLARKNLFRKID